MKTLGVIFHLAIADFFERARRYSFLLTLAAIIFLGVLVNNGTLFFYVSNGVMTAPVYFRGEFNSAWIGTMTVLVTNSFLGLFGFYLVNDCIERDSRTGVGQIIATTPVRRATYLIGKWISNFMVLTVLELIMAAAAAVMVLLKGEAPLELGALLMPFLAVALPYMALVAASGVFFETIPWLRGALGNVIYFFLWLVLVLIVLTGGMLAAILNDPMAASAIGNEPGAGNQTQAMMELPALKDPMGFNVFRESLFSAARTAYPNEQVSMMGVQSAPSRQFKVFNWPGLIWTPGIVGGQWAWAAIGLGLILLSAAWFARFDPAREGMRRMWKMPEAIKNNESIAALKKILQFSLPSLSPLISKLVHINPFLGVLLAELRMLLKGRRWWWWLVFAGLNISIFIYPNELTKAYLIPCAWLLPLAIWSEMGNRERKNNTHQIVFSSSRPVLRQLPAAWLAGILATALLAFPTAVFHLLNGDFSSLPGWIGAVVFIPSLALALGVFSSGSRVFEVFYVILWYVGPVSRTRGFDFTTEAPLVFLVAATGLLLLSAFWRSKQVRM